MQVAEETKQNRIVKCPACEGIGSISCIENGNVNPYCIEIPPRNEERCNCCDGKGWIIFSEQMISSSFCKRVKK